MATYYVSQSSGNDGWPGTIGQPWQTIWKLVITGFAADDTIYLKRGDVWREAWYVGSGGNAGHPVTYDAYDVGVAPRITGCDLLTGWALTGGSIYQANYVDAISTFMLLEDGEHLTRVANLGALVAPGQFYPDNAANVIYAWCTDNADPDTHVMEIGARYDVVSCDDRQHIRFNNLHFHGAGGEYGRGFGVKPTWLTPEDIVLTDCESDHSYYTGIWAYYSAGFTAIDTFTLDGCTVHDNLNFGVRIEGESTARRMTNILIDDCEIYDNGTTVLGQMGTYLRHINAPIVRYCDLYENTGSLEWSDNLYLDACIDVSVHHNRTWGGDYSGIHLDVGSYGAVYLNICRDHGYNGIWIEEHQTGSGHASTIYNNTCVRNKHGMVFGPGSTIHEVSGVTAKNNIFADCKRAAMEINEEVGGDYLNNTLDYNCYSVDTGDPQYLGEFLYEDPRVAHTFAEWKAYTSWDAHSLFTDPLFTDAPANDFTIPVVSPCREAGTDVGLTQDYIGTSIPQGNEFDIGAYEYILLSTVLRRRIEGY
jgi:hypothetical protein